MTRDESISLLQVVRELSVSDAVIDAFLKLSEVEARAEIVGVEATQEFIDEVIIDKHLLSLVKTLLIFQTKRVEMVTGELAAANQSATNLIQ